MRRALILVPVTCYCSSSVASLVFNVLVWKTIEFHELAMDVLITNLLIDAQQ